MSSGQQTNSEITQISDTTGAIASLESYNRLGDSSVQIPVGTQKQRGRTRHGKSSYNKRGVNFRTSGIASLLTSSLGSDQSYRLAEAADATGLTPQYILNIIIRYNTISPIKTQDDKNRDSYKFTADEVKKLGKIKILTDQGRPIREAAEMVRNDTDFSLAGQRFIDALDHWRKNLDSESWDDLVEAITMIPLLDNREKYALLHIEGLGESLIDTAASLKITSIRELTSLLDGAYEKVGRSIFYLLLQSGLERIKN